jgi:Outer membrane protein beta-barrel domain
MKYLIKLLPFLIALPLSTHAQKMFSHQKIDFGVKLGVNIANLSNSDAYTATSIIGVHSGLFLKIPMYKKFSFQPELCFMGNGSELVYNNIILGSVRYNLSYLQLPILVDYKIFDFLHVQAGPYISRLLTTKIFDTKTNNAFNFEQNLSDNDFNKFDVGLIGGASFHWQSLSIGARYNLGVLQVANDVSISGTNYSFANGSNRVASIFIALVP